MIEHRLVIPEPVLGHIQSTGYTDTEVIDYYLAKEVDMGAYTAVVPLVRIPMGTSSRMSVIEDDELLQALAKYLDADQTNAAILLHYHPLDGPSGPDADHMRERFGANNRLCRYGIFVGPNGPRFYETDGRQVFPMRSQLSTFPHSQTIGSLQEAVAQAFSEAYRQR